MKLPSLPFKALAFCTMAAVASFPSHASEHFVDKSPSGDQLMAEIVAGYSRSLLDSGGWENTFMRNAAYTAVHTLITVAVGSGATSPADDSNRRTSM